MLLVLFTETSFEDIAGTGENVDKHFLSLSIHFTDVLNLHFIRHDLPIYFIFYYEHIKMTLKSAKSFEKVSTSVILYVVAVLFHHRWKWSASAKRGSTVGIQDIYETEGTYLV